MSRTALAATAIALLLAFAPLHATRKQAAPQGNTSLIVGQVVDAATARPIRGAIVVLSSPALVGASQGPPTGSAGGTAVSSLRATTTGDGMFVFRDLPRGDYSLTASKPRYVPGAYGRRRPDGPAAQLALADGEKVGDLSIPMWKLSAIGGTVTDERGEPVVNVEVQAFQRTTIAGQRRYIRTVPVTTDDRGTYRFAGLPPGDFVVGVASTQVSVPLSMLEAYRDALGAARADRMKLIVPIFDIGGTTALPGTPRAIQSGSVVRSLNAATPPPGDEHGRVFVYPTTFYPAARLAARATVVTTTSGEERNGVDIQLQPIATAPVSGLVTGPEDAVGGVALRLVPDGGDSGISIESAAATLTATDGTFSFPAVPLGSYVLKASKRPVSSSMGTPTVIQVGNMTYATSISSSQAPTGPPPPIYWSEIAVTVGSSAISSLAVDLRAGLRVSGRVQFEGTRPAPAADAVARILIGLDRPDASTPSTMAPPEARAGRDGEFELPGVEPGRYVLRVSSGPPGWSVKAISAGERELPDPLLDVQRDTSGIVLSFTDSPVELTGRITGRSGSPDDEAMVVLFPTDPQAWTAGWRNPLRFRAAAARRDGSYRILSIPPGEYYVAAIPGDTGPGWEESAVLETLAQGAARVKITAGSKTAQDVTTKEVR